MKAIKILVMFLMLGGMTAKAQIGEHRNDFSIGVNGGYLMSSVGFTPSIPRKPTWRTDRWFLFQICLREIFQDISALSMER